MTKKFTILMLAAIVGLVFAVGSAFTAKKNNAGTKQIDKTSKFDFNYYYTFTGSPGSEDDESLWTLIDVTTYNNSTCSSAKNGCVIKTISSNETAPTHPAFVPVTGTGTDMTPDVDLSNIAAAKFKNQ